MSTRLRQYIQSWKPVFWLCLLLILIYAAYRIFNTLPVLVEMRPDWDTRQYNEISTFLIWEKGFWAGIKPLTAPLVFKLFQRQATPIGIFFLFFSTFSWSFLAVQFSRSLRHPLSKLGGLTFVLLFSLTRNVVGWDGILISESIAFSMLVLFIGMWFSLLREPGKWKTWILVLISFFWVFARDTNAYLGLMLGILLLGVGLLIKKQRHLLAIAAALIVLFVLSTVSANLGQRWVQPFQHVLSFRIWQSKEDTGYFKACGMPASPEIYDMVGEIWIDEDWALYDEFRAWVLESGKSCYYRWLLSDLGRTIQEPLAEIEQMMGYYKKLYAPRFQPLLPNRVNDLLIPYQSGLLLVYLAFFGCGLVLHPKVLKGNPAWFVPLALIVLFLPHAVLVWHGDAADIDRHSLTAGIQFFLGFWFLLILFFDLGINSIYPSQPAPEQEV